MSYLLDARNLFITCALAGDKRSAGRAEKAITAAAAHELPEHELRVGQDKSPLLDQCQQQDPPNSHGQVSCLKEMRMEQGRESREPGIVAQAPK